MPRSHRFERLLAPSESSVEIAVVGTRADLVSGGDALVEVRLFEGVDPGQVWVTVNDQEVTEQFALRPNERFQGLVTGLREGTNEVRAVVQGRAPGRSTGAVLTVTNHPRSGPVISGPQVQPWLCETERFGLEASDSSTCEVATRYDFVYRSTVTNRFELYAPESPPNESMIAETTTDEGHTVPYIVRKERGVLNRGVYDIAVLFDPDQDWEPWNPQQAWNGKLHLFFQGGTRSSHRQSNTIWDVLDGPCLHDLPLARGFAVAAHTLDQANEVLSNETTIMLKEHFTKTYGPPRYTTSFGASNGSRMQLSLANNYPGVVDGILPAQSWNDRWSEHVDHKFHLSLLFEYFTKTSPHLWADPADQAAVYGTPPGSRVPATRAVLLGGGAYSYDPRGGCTGSEPEPEWVYDPQANPRGVRCTPQDWQEQVLGQRPPDSWGPVEEQIGTGFANRPLDNVGVQYGLLALLEGQITAEQFVDLNTKVGGRDIDWGWIPERTVADRNGLRNLYRSGLLNDARQLDRVPIIDVRIDDGGMNDFHVSIHTEVMRARLIAANGHADNYVAWQHEVDHRGTVSATDGSQMWISAFLTLDQWLAAIEADDTTDPVEDKVLRHKPAHAKDTCWAAGQPGACGDRLTHVSLPRIRAGGPLTSDVFKCQLKPLDWTDYGPVRFSDAQKQRLHDAFPDGVCDYSRPGVEQQPAAGVWPTFAETIGGQPLGPEPRSVLFKR